VEGALANSARQRAGVRCAGSRTAVGVATTPITGGCETSVDETIAVVVDSVTDVFGERVDGGIVIIAVETAAPIVAEPVVIEVLWRIGALAESVGAPIDRAIVGVIAVWWRSRLADARIARCAAARLLACAEEPIVTDIRCRTSARSALLTSVWGAHLVGAAEGRVIVVLASICGLVAGIVGTVVLVTTIDIGSVYTASGRRACLDAIAERTVVAGTVVRGEDAFVERPITGIDGARDLVITDRRCSWLAAVGEGASLRSVAENVVVAVLVVRDIGACTSVVIAGVVCAVYLVIAGRCRPRETPGDVVAGLVAVAERVIETVVVVGNVLTTQRGVAGVIGADDVIVTIERRPASTESSITPLGTVA
jgi:hypothetical protein